MLTPDNLAANLPSPRDDEPENLRQDILDELNDHLACGTRREQLLTGGTTSEAANRAIQHFGDPVQIARRLWRDALWEKIMSQRMLMASCSAMVLICCAVLGVTWKWLDRQEQSLAAWQASNQEQMREQRELFERLIEATREKSGESKEISEWNPVELTFVSEKDGTPAEGVEISFKPDDSSRGIPVLTETTGKDGKIRFKNVLFGTYTLSARTSRGQLTLITLTLPPGEGLTRTIVCPEPLSMVTCNVKVNWPAEIDTSRTLTLIAPPNSLSFYRQLDGVGWSIDQMLEPPFSHGMIVDSTYGITRMSLGTSAPSLIVGDIQAAAYMLERNGDSSLMTTTWPDVNYKPNLAAALIRLPALPYGGGPNPAYANISLSMFRWDAHLEPGDPQTLVFTPDAQAVCTVQYAIRKIDDMQTEPEAIVPDPLEKIDLSKPQTQESSEYKPADQTAPEEEVQ